jgi:hypothetical protein
MSDAELANAEWWASLWSQIENWAFFFVVVFLAIEFAALKFGSPYKATLDRARELKIAVLTKDAEELNKQNLELRKQLIPRFISDQQSQKMIERLAPFKGTPFEIVSDPAAEYDFTSTLIATLQKSGWVLKSYGIANSGPPVGAPFGQIERAPLGSGVQLVVNRADIGEGANPLPPAAQALMAALTEALQKSVSGVPASGPGAPPRGTVLIEIEKAR